MRHVIYGAGGIGGVMGGRLHQASHEVVLVARGPHHDAIRDKGLRLQSPEDDATLQIEVVDHPSKVMWRDDDVVYLGMKSQDTQEALFALRAVAPPQIPVISLQNGVCNEPTAIRFFGNVYGVCVMCPTNFLEPGVVQAYSAPVTGLLDIGRYPTGIDDVAVEVSQALSSSTYVSEPRADIMRWKYGKLMMNLGNGIDAMCGPAARGTDLFRKVREEGVAVLRAAGIDFVDSEEDAARRGDHMRMRPIAGQLRGGGSTWQSLARGSRSVETDYLNGEITKLGRELGTPTPANELMQRLTAEAAQAGIEAGSVDPEELVAQLAATAR